MADSIDWPGLMRLGLGTLGLSPRVFWNMTPAEFRAASEGAGLSFGVQAIDRDWLNGMMNAFPDDDPK